jgi:hypothetical protein
MIKIADSVKLVADAEKLAIAKDYFWTFSRTEVYVLYIFDDNSFIVEKPDSDTLAVDADCRESVMRYIDFLGPDADLDKARINEMMRHFR